MRLQLQKLLPRSWHEKFAAAFAYPIEAIVLIGLIFCLPIFEAPKNILLFAYAVVWLFNRTQAKKWDEWDSWDSLILLWIASGYVVATFSGLHHGEWRGANDILRYGALLWMIRRSGYGRQALQWLMLALVASAVVAVLVAYWSLFVSHSRAALELNSVGHVNHSAIYLTVSYGAMLFLAMAYWRGERLRWRVGASLITFLLALSVLISASRGAVGVALLLTLIAGLVWLRHSPYVLPILLLLIAMGIGASYWGKMAIMRKQEHYFETNNTLSYRNQIWDAAIVAWRRYPLMGVGMRNFDQINAERLRHWGEGRKVEFSAEHFRGTSHAHSLYLNTLAERGLFGFSILLIVLLTWLRWLQRLMPKKDAEALAWALWGGSLSAWVVTVGIGTVNTTLHHEHAILSVLLLGLWHAYLRLENNPGQNPSI